MPSTTRSSRLLVFVLGFVLALALGTGTALAQTDGGPYVSDDGQTSGVSGDGTEVLGSQVTRAQADASALALTGGEALTMALVGGGLVLVGGAAVATSRRRRTADVV